MLLNPITLKIKNNQVSASHSIEMQHKNQELNKLRIKIIKLTIQKQLIRLQLYITMATHIMRHLVLTLNLMKTNKLIVNPINLRHLCQIMINKTLKSSGTYNEKYKCKKEETRKNENAKSLVQPQQDDKTTSEQTKMKESREQEITNEQKQLQSKDVKMLNKKNQNIDQEKSQEKIKVQQSNIEKAQKSSRIDGKLDNQYNKDATQSDEGLHLRTFQNSI